MFLGRLGSLARLQACKQGHLPCPGKDDTTFQSLWLGPFQAGPVVRWHYTHKSNKAKKICCDLLLMMC